MAQNDRKKKMKGRGGCGGSILRWQRGERRGPYKAAGRITSNSFSRLLEAPAEGALVSLWLPTGQTAKRFLFWEQKASLYLLAAPASRWKPFFFFIYIFGGDAWFHQLEPTCWMQLAMAAWVSMSRDWICWMNASFSSHCRHDGWHTVRGVRECVRVCVWV